MTHGNATSLRPNILASSVKYDNLKPQFFARVVLCTKQPALLTVLCVVQALGYLFSRWEFLSSGIMLEERLSSGAD